MRGSNRMKQINFKQISKKIKELRISKGLTQEYVASVAEVNTSHISNIENNRVKISLVTLIHVCNALGTTVDYILADEYTDSSTAYDQAILNELKDCNNATKEQILQIIQILKK